MSSGFTRQPQYTPVQVAPAPAQTTPQSSTVVLGVVPSDTSQGYFAARQPMNWWDRAWQNSIWNYGAEPVLSDEDKKRAAKIDDQLAQLRQSVAGDSNLSDIQKKQFDVGLNQKLAQLQGSFQGSQFTPYADQREALVKTFQNAANQMSFNGIANPQTKGTTWSADDRMAMQAAIANVVGQFTKQNSDAIDLGNKQLEFYAKNIGGSLGDLIRSQATMRKQGVDEMNTAWLQSLSAQPAIEALQYRKNLNDQVANLQTQALIQGQGQGTQDPLAAAMGYGAR